MERYLISGGPGPARAAELDQTHGPQMAKMAYGSSELPASHTTHTAQIAPATTEDQYGRMAQAVAALLSPTITAAVDRSVSAGIDQLRRELREQAGRLNEVKHCLSDLEEEAQSSQTAALQASQTQHYILKKLDDLENRTRHNNLRVIGLPEAYNSGTLTELRPTLIPEALCIATPCIVERARRVGAPSNDRRSPRSINVRYLNYSDRVVILKSFCNAKSFQLEVHKLFIFADYSQEVSRKRKAFRSICTALHLKGLKFTLSYPATLRLTDQAGETKSFTHPEEAASYLQTCLHIPQDVSSMEINRCPEGPRDQRSPSKGPPKRFRCSNTPGSPKHR